MKIYVVYVSGDYACAVYVATNKFIAEKTARNFQKYGSYIEEYDLTNNCLIELDCG